MKKSIKILSTVLLIACSSQAFAMEEEPISQQIRTIMKKHVERSAPKHHAILVGTDTEILLQCIYSSNFEPFLDTLKFKATQGFLAGLIACYQLTVNYLIQT